MTMVNEKNINLREKMVELADKKLEHYKTDLDRDFNIMLDKEMPLGVYYWYIRESGTHMMPNHRVFVKDDWANTEAIYWAKYKPKIYKINLKERKKKNFFGDIEELKLNDFIQIVKEGTKEAEGVNIKVLTKKGEVLRTSVNGVKNAFHKALDNLNILSEDITLTYIEKYMF